MVITATLARDIEAEDTGVLSVKWRNGALGSLNCTMLTYPKNLEGSITILGEKGTVRIGGVAVNEIQEWQFADKQPDDEQIKHLGLRFWAPAVLRKRDQSLTWPS